MMVFEGLNGFRMSPKSDLGTKIMVAKKHSNDEGFRGVLVEVEKNLVEVEKNLVEMEKAILQTRINTGFARSGLGKVFKVYKV